MTAIQHSEQRVLPDFAPATFAPAPQPAPKAKIVAAQGAIEAKLMMRHGEQQLLSVIIPLLILITLRFAPFSTTFGGLRASMPMVLAVAATSAGFTGQAIALAFDRRYGALKRAGASGVPTWAIIAGKIVAVCAMVAFQVTILGIAAFLLGFRTSMSGLFLAALALVVGVCAFSALGLCLGGSLSSEIVLAVANLIWFVLLGTVGWVLYSTGLGSNGWLNIVPSVALASGLAESFAGKFPTVPLAALLGWAVIASVAARTWFRFEG
ncbi:MAG: ABC transporter permease [Corynebacterium sp.]|nr:ABC transporter permease [Corynebacterium sp.]